MRLLLVILLVGCTPAADITPGVCGNGVLEGIEDCEGTNNLFCSQCQFTCFSPAFGLPAEVCEGAPDGKCCPEDMACGVDSRCHKPSGELEQRTVNASFGGLEYVIANADEDGIGDIIAVRNGKIEMLFGSPTDPFVRSTTRGTPAAAALPAIGDITEDGLADVVVPTTGGLFTFENRYGSSGPGVFPILTNRTTEYLRVGSVGNGATLRLEHETMAPETVQLQLQLASGSNPPPKTPCGLTLTQGTLAGHGLPVFRDGVIIWVPFLHKKGTTLELCLEQAQSNNPSVAKDLTPNLSFLDKGELVWGNFESSDPCPEIAMPVHDTGQSIDRTEEWVGHTSAGACTWTSSDTRQVPGYPLASVRRPAGSDAIVTNRGIYINGITNFTTSHPWSIATTGDFDHDGLDDFAVANELGEDIEIFEQRPAGWRVINLPFTGFVRDLASGDIDGDNFDDLVIGTIDARFNGSVYLAFGGAATLTDPQLAVTIGHLIALTTAPLRDPSIDVVLDVYDDLVVSAGFLAPGEDPMMRSPGTVSFLYGSGNRELSAPFLPMGRNQAFGVALQPPGVLGFFRTLGASCTVMPAILDVLTLERSDPAFESSAAYDVCPMGKYDLNKTRLSVIPQGSHDLILGLSPSTTVDGSTAQSGSEIDCGIWGWTDGTAITRLTCDKLALDIPTNSLARITLDKLNNAKFRTTPNGTIVTVIGLDNAPGQNQPHAVDWVLATIPVPTLTQPTVLEDLVKEADPDIGIQFCFDVAMAELGTAHDVGGAAYGAGTREQVIACHYEQGTLAGTRIYARYSNIDKDFFVPVGEVLDQFVDIEAGDVTGDGLDDIVVRNIVDGSVQLFRQCDHTCNVQVLGEGTKQ